MCGIAGRFAAGSADARLDTVAAMTATLHHRGPDGGDVWCDDAAGIGLGHRRLSIIDLSEAGHQPMHSSCGRFVLSYNGEVYNADDLREELRTAGRPFRGHSDTEAIVEGFAVWGIKETVDRLIGMFAFAVWDRQKRELTLVRDRIGIKPLYWSFDKGVFLFGSELKALREAPDFDPGIDRDAITAFLRHNYVPAPRTVYAKAKKLEPGTLLTVSADRQPAISRYWAVDDTARAGRQDPFTGSDAEATDALDALLGDAVRRRMISDVPLGAFLSGGIDSSTVVALMQAGSTRKVRTFSIGFDVEGYNEADYAAEVARHLGTEHTELYVTPGEARDVIPKLPEIYDEPFADSSQIPTYCLSALTRQHVTVALSGDGGDEVFGGYVRYFIADRMRRTVFRMPKAIRRLGAAGIHALPPPVWDQIFRMVPKNRRPPAAGDRLHKFARVMRESPDHFYRMLVSHWMDPEALVVDGTEPCGPLSDPSNRKVAPDYVERMQYLDTITYLPDDILTKVDRASMAVSLEVRVPIIDHRVIEFAWRLPKHMKVRDDTGKWLLRQVLNRYVPAHLIDRPKMGFGVPIDAWLRGPLRDWAEDLLREDALAETGLFDAGPIRRTWQEHLDGKRNWQYLLWDILMVQAWMAHSRAGAG